MFHTFVLQPFIQVARYLTGPIAARQTQLVDDVDLIAARTGSNVVWLGWRILQPSFKESDESKTLA